MATEEDKTNTGALLTLVAVGTLVMVGISLAVTAITREELARATGEKEAVGSHAYQALRGEQVAKLATSGVPIEQAMQQVVNGLQRDPNSATPPAAAAVAPTPAPAPSGSAAEATPPAHSAAAPVSPPPGKSAPAAPPAQPKPMAPAAEPAKPKPPAPAPATSAHG
jgi:hypothetical protein